MKYGALAQAADTSRLVLDHYDAYLASKRDLQREADVLHWILTKNAERVREGTWSASAAGTCLRQQQFTYLGFPKIRSEADGLNIFRNGDYVHLRYQVAGIIGGWLTDVEVPVNQPGVRGTIDGLCSWGDLLEIKSINAHGFAAVQDFGPKQAHKYQATAYMICTGITRTRFVYENKNTNSNAEFVYDIEHELSKKVMDDWMLLEEYGQKEQLAPMLSECLNEPNKWCPFRDRCEEASWPRLLLVG